MPDPRLEARIGVMPQLDETPVVHGGIRVLTSRGVDLGPAQVAMSWPPNDANGSGSFA